jgi:hypothetical protein
MLNFTFNANICSRNHVWFNLKKEEIIMKAEFTAIIEKAPEGGFWAICPEVSGANGQGETIEEAKINLREAIELILVPAPCTLLFKYLNIT